MTTQHPENSNTPGSPVMIAGEKKFYVYCTTDHPHHEEGDWHHDHAEVFLPWGAIYDDYLAIVTTNNGKKNYHEVRESRRHGRTDALRLDVWVQVRGFFDPRWWRGVEVTIKFHYPKPDNDTKEIVLLEDSRKE